MRFLRSHGVSETESPRVAFVSVLPLKRGLNSQSLSLPAGSRPQRWSFLHFAHPQASWVTLGWNLCAPWPAPSFRKQGSERLGPFLSSCLVGSGICQVCVPAGVLCPLCTRPAGGRQRLCVPSPPSTCLPSLPHASSQPESRRGSKGPINSSLTQLDPERQRWILKASATTRHLLGERSLTCTSDFHASPQRGDKRALKVAEQASESGPG